MQVETYEVNEATADGKVDKLDGEAVALIERLGLRGQRAIVSRASDGVVALMPYQAMTAAEVAVYQMLFPQHDALDAYSAGPLPLRVLQVASLAADKQWFTRLEVWHKQTGSAKEDPLLIGVIGGNHSWEVRGRFLLARWGDALRPYSALLAEAATLARASLRAAATKATTVLAAGAAQLDHVSDAAAIQWALAQPFYVSGENPPRD